MDSNLQFPKPAVLKISANVLESILALLTDKSNPLSVSHVCKTWREVALALPALWSTLILNKDIYSVSSSLARITTFIARSGSHPLNLDFTYNFTNSTGGKVLRKTLELVLPLAERWRYFYLSTNSDHSIQFLYSQIQDLAVPLLKHFSVDVIKATGYETFLSLPPAAVSKTEIFLGGAPLLTTFRGLGNTPSCFQPDLSNITSLYLRDLPSNVLTLGYFRTIFSLPDLECLSLHGAVPSSLANAKPSQCRPAIITRRLKHLHFALKHPNAFHVFLYTVASSLESLFLVDATIPGDCEGFATKYSRNVIQLRFLRCNIKMANVLDFAGFLTMFPRVRFLTMKGGQFPVLVSQLLLAPVEKDKAPDMLSSMWVGKMVTLPDLLTLTCEHPEPVDLSVAEGLNTAKWRDGLLINPTRQQLKKIEVEQKLPEAAWDQEWRFPPDPLEYDKRLYIQERFQGLLERFLSGSIGHARFDLF
ncbi:hypothetical protein BDN72DRAFT_849167 [Pluteus cervinus]|uniref:Uncharacterized protein n=1 Tax=Pluteus cervinus TaxID=181527 RepID=A0ACD3A8L7_9AGAR|nr:hypothetical protein BDN72DRAFT_849167 [Pluteus cervinus]